MCKVYSYEDNGDGSFTYEEVDLGRGKIISFNQWVIHPDDFNFVDMEHPTEEEWFINSLLRNGSLPKERWPDILRIIKKFKGKK